MSKNWIVHGQVCARMQRGLYSNLKNFFCGLKTKETMEQGCQNEAEHHLLTTSFRRDLMMTFWPRSPLPPVSGAFFFVFFTVSCPGFWL